MLIHAKSIASRILEFTILKWKEKINMLSCLLLIVEPDLSVFKKQKIRIQSLFPAVAQDFLLQFQYLEILVLLNLTYCP